MNKGLFFNGEKFISASRASEELGYASDYIGELARKGLVDARMIGRTWYVSKRSLANYRRNSNARKPSSEASAPATVSMQNGKDIYLDGEKLMSSVKAAQEFGYAQDYIGELARKGLITAKRVGRNWFVSKKSIIAYRKENSPAINKSNVREAKFTKSEAEVDFKPRAERQKSISISNAYVPTVNLSAIASTTGVRISAHEAPKLVLPDLKKEVVKIKPHFIYKPLVTAVSALIIVVTGYNFLGFIAPDQAVVLDVHVANMSSKLTAAASNAVGFGQYSLENVVVGIRTFLHLGGTPQPELASNGIVVMPDSANHAQAVNQVKDSFSDPVNVNVDAEGDSGVVTPVFHNGDDTQNYAFVLVPVSGTKSAFSSSTSTTTAK